MGIDKKEEIGNENWKRYCCRIWDRMCFEDYQKVRRKFLYLSVVQHDETDLLAAVSDARKPQSSFFDVMFQSSVA